MTETIAVLFIFFILVLFGIIFYYKYSQISFKEQQEKMLGKRATDITLKAIFLPELRCSRGQAEPEDNCFDLIKLRNVNSTFKEHFPEYYYSLFPYTTLRVNEIYPTNQSWVLYDKPKPNWERKEAAYFVVALKDDLKTEEEGKYSFAVLTVEVYG